MADIFMWRTVQFAKGAKGVLCAPLLLYAMTWVYLQVITCCLHFIAST